MIKDVKVTERELRVRRKRCHGWIRKTHEPQEGSSQAPQTLMDKTTKKAFSPTQNSPNGLHLRVSSLSKRSTTTDNKENLQRVHVLFCHPFFQSKAKLGILLGCTAVFPVLPSQPSFFLLSFRLFACCRPTMSSSSVLPTHPSVRSSPFSCCPALPSLSTTAAGVWISGNS